MAKRHEPEEIVAKLRQVDVLTSQGHSVADAVRAIGVTEVTCCRWRQEHGGLKTDQVRRMKELELGNRRLRKAVADLTLDKRILAEAARGHCLEPRAPARLCRAHQAEAGRFRAPRLQGARPASLDASRKVPRGRDDEAALTADIIALAREHGRYGYRKSAALLRAAGWLVNAKRVERIWRREGLKGAAKQPRKGRLWLNDGSCVRLRPEHPNHVGTS
jgi:transposase-like protein